MILALGAGIFSARFPNIIRIIKFKKKTQQKHGFTPTIDQNIVLPG
jgi:hypothetical protein